MYSYISGLIESVKNVVLEEEEEEGERKYEQPPSPIDNNNKSVIDINEKDEHSETYPTSNYYWSDDEDEEEDETVLVNHDTNQHTYDNYSEDEEEQEDFHYEEEEDTGEYYDDEDTTDNSNNYEEGEESSESSSKSNNQRKQLNKNGKMLRNIVNIFIKHSSFSDLNIPLFHLNHIKGKIHLCRHIEDQKYYEQEGLFPNIFGSNFIDKESFIPSIYFTQGTFFVSTKLDFTYSKLIDNAFIKSRLDRLQRSLKKEKTTKNIEEETQQQQQQLYNINFTQNDLKHLEHLINNQELYINNYQTMKNSNYKQCTDNHILQQQPNHNGKNGNIKLCPNEWLIYTNRNSPFFTFIKQILQNDISVNFLESSLININFLSFHLVLFLCGDNEYFQNEFSIDTFENVKLSEEDVINIDSNHKSSPSIISSKYKQINDWVSLPIWFKLIFDAFFNHGLTYTTYHNTSPSPSMNMDNNNNNVNENQ
jgi:hypothetical protein